MLDLQWPSLSCADWASYERRVNGARMAAVDGVWWRRVRMFFYRPLDVLSEYSEDTCAPVLGRWLGAVQFPVSSRQPTGAKIRLILSEGTSGYDMESLPSSIRRDIRKGCRVFEVRRIDDPQLLVDQGHRVYQAFQSRTGYAHLRGRCSPSAFAEWARALFRSSGLGIVGAFHGSDLCAVAVTFRIGENLHYNSFFGDDFARANCASDAVLHRVREAVSGDSGIRRIYSAMAGMPRGLDGFYLRRGFRVVERDAIVRGNPLALIGLRVVAPPVYARLIGAVPSSGNAVGECLREPATSRSGRTG